MTNAFAILEEMKFGADIDKTMKNLHYILNDTNNMIRTAHVIEMMAIYFTLSPALKEVKEKKGPDMTWRAFMSTFSTEANRLATNNPQIKKYIYRLKPVHKLVIMALEAGLPNGTVPFITVPQNKHTSYIYLSLLVLWQILSSPNSLC